jgi:hypothetical protein
VSGNFLQEHPEDSALAFPSPLPIGEIAGLFVLLAWMKGLDIQKRTDSRNVTASLKFSKCTSDKHPNALENPSGAWSG